MLRSGAIPNKMLLVRIIEKKNLMIILGQVRLGKGQLCPEGLGKDYAGLEPPTLARNRGKNL